MRFVYNHYLAERIQLYEETQKGTTFFKQNKSLTDLKKEYEWLQEPDKNALQYALRDLNQAYQNFFRRVQQGGLPGFPKFKSKKHSKKSYSTANNKTEIRIEGSRIRFPKLGFVKAKISRTIPDEHRIISATISQEPSGKYYASLLTEFEYNPPEIELDSDTALGLDYSSPHFYVDSNGVIADMPHFYRIAEQKLAREQRKLSKMVKGSNNWYKQKRKVAVAYEKVRNQRKDWQHKLSTKLADEHDIICLEDINLQNMAQSLHLAKATNDNGFGQFREFLKYKMAWRGKMVVTIDKWFPSSKTCRHCGYVNSELTLGDRVWVCPSCGNEIDRDLNAAINYSEAKNRRDYGDSLLTLLGLPRLSRNSSQ